MSKIFKILSLFLLFVLFVFIVLFRVYKIDGLYSFLYPRSWFVSDIQGVYFNGLVLSDRNISDDQTDFGRGGFIHVSHEDLGVNLSVENYVKQLKDNEALKIKAGNLPTIPGPSQYEYIDTDSLGRNGFDRVTSLSALPDDMNARLYWKISNNKLYQVFIKYPQNKNKTASFNTVAKLFFLTFNTK